MSRTPQKARPKTRPKPQKAGRGRRVLRRIAIGLLVLVALIVVPLLAVLFTASGTELALRRFVTWYDDGIAGSVQVGDIDGALGRGVTVTDLQLRDSQNHPLITIERARLDLRAISLLRGAVVLDEAHVENLDVHLWPEGPGFADLGRKPDKPKEGPPGPDLRFLEVVAELDLDDVTVVQHGPQGVQTIVSDASLSGELSATGQSADLEIEALWGSVPTADVHVAALSGEIHWASPLVRVDRLEAITTAGILHRLTGHLHTLDQHFEASLAANVFPAALGLDAPAIELDVLAGGAPQSAWLTASLAAPGDATTTLSALGSWDPQVSVLAVGSAWLRVEQWLEGAPSTELAYLLAGQNLKEDLGAVVAVACASCAEPLGVTARARGPLDDLQVDARSMLPGARVDARLSIDEDGWQRAEITADVSRASRAADALRPFVDIPPVGGALELHAVCRPGQQGPACEAELEGKAIRFEDHRLGSLEGDVSLTMTEDAPRIRADLKARDVESGQTELDELDLRVSGTPESLDVDAKARQGERTLEAKARIERRGPRTTVQLQELRGDIPGLELELEDPSSLQIGPDAVTVDDLDLRVGRRGRIKADGRLAWRGRSDLRATLSRVELDALADHFAPDSGLSGRISGRLLVQGLARQPSIDLRMRADELGVRGIDIGDVGLQLSQRAGRTELGVSVVNRGATLHVSGSAPIALDLAEREVDVKPDEEVALSLTLHRLRLRHLDELPVSMEGLVEGKVAMSGTLAEPTVVGEFRAFHLEAAGIEIGNVRLELVHRDGVARANVLGVGDLARRVAVSVRVPVRWSVQPWRAELREGGRYTASVKVDQLDLSDLHELAPGLEGLAGRFELEMTAESEGGPLQANLRFLAVDVTVRGHEVGSIEGSVELDEHDARAEVLASGAAMRLFQARAKVPLTVTIPSMRVDWDPADHHVLATQLRDVRLGALGEIVGVPMTGELDGEIIARGRNDSLRAGVELAASPVGFAGADLGTATVSASWDGHALYASVVQARGRSSLVASAEVPLRIDPAHGKIEWLESEPHRLDLVAKGLDEELLEAFVNLPSTWDFEASALLAASGPAADPRISARVRARFQGYEDIETAVHVAMRARGDDVWARLLVGANGGAGLAAKAHTELPLLALLRGEAELSDAPLQASVSAEDFPLRDLDPLLPAAIHDPRGVLTAHASADGTLLRPNLAGAIAIDDAAVTVVPLNQRFDHIGLLAQLEGPRLRTELDFKSGDGVGTGSGWLHLAKGETRGKLALRTDELPVVKPGLPLMKLDTQIDANLDATGELTLLEVDIHDTFLDVLDTSTERVTPIPDHDGVVFVDAAGRREAKLTARKGASEDAAADDSKEPWLPAPTKVVISIEDPVVVKGSDIDMAWDGRVVAVHRKGEPLKARGQIEVNRGRVSLLRREFEIEQGQIFLPETGDLDPFVALRAVADISDVTVTMQVRGRASRPDLVLSSSPPMSQSDIFALLVTGTADSTEQDDTDFGAQAASLLAAFNNPALQRELHDRIGIDRVGVGFGATLEQPIVSLGKRFGRNVYVETRYHHNAPPEDNEAEVRLEYYFRPPAWSVETFFGDAAAGGVALWWRRTFGLPFDDETRADRNAKNARPSKTEATSDLARRDGSQ